MVTFAQAQERAEEWVNGDVPAYQHREVRVREFGLGFVVWAEDRAEGPRSDGGAQKLVIARDSGEATLWPSLPVGEVIRRYEEEYGRADADPAPVPAPSARVDLNQTSFLLSPPEWLQEAADKLGIPDGRKGEAGAGAGASAAAASGGGESAPESGGSGASGMSGASGAGAGASGASGVSATGGGASSASGTSGVSGTSVPAAGVAWPAAGGPGDGGAPGAPAGATPWAGTDTNADGGDDRSVPLPETVFAPPLAEEETAAPDAETALISGGSQLPPTAVAPAVGEQRAAGGTGGAADGAPAAPGTPPAPAASAPRTPPAPAASAFRAPPVASPDAPARPLPPHAGDIADAATSKASPAPRRGGGVSTPPPPSAPPSAPPGAPGARPGSTPPPPASAPGGYVPTQLASALGGPDSSGAPQPPGPPNAPGTPGTPPGGVHHAATMLADPGRPGTTPPPPGPPGTPGAGRSGAPGVPGAPGAPGVPGGPGGPGVPGGPGASNGPGAPAAPAAPAGPGASGTPAGQGAPGTPGVPGTPGAPGAPKPPGAPGAPGAPAAPGAPGAPGAPASGQAGVHHAATVLATPPAGAPGAPPPGAVPPPPPGAMPPPSAAPHGAVPPAAAPPFGAVPPGTAPHPGAMPPPGMPPGAVPPPGMPPAYGYPPQAAGLPTVGPGYQAVLRYRAQDGSEQQVIRRSAPGTPHPEWQIFHELRALNVPPDQVLELHTELESCELPGAYCSRMIREQWPQARITSIAPYGTDHASRQQGMRELLAHQGELHQVADGPARPAPVRAPLPPVPPAPPVPPEAVGQELAAAFGPGVFRFEQAAVDRQGVPPVVAHTLVAAGLPMDMGPFFWAQAQPGRPVPTLAELAAERGVRPAPDAGSYLVVGSDFGKAICVQYGTANIMAVPVEAGPGGAAVPPQFVNTGLPEFARCLALLGRMWRLRYGLNQEQAGRWTVDFQAQLAALDAAALGSPESWWSVLLEQMWDGLL